MIFVKRHYNGVMGRCSRDVSSSLPGGWIVGQ